MNTGKDLVIIGGGHAATIAIRAAKKGLVKPTAIVAVAPTWSGPLPIHFGRDSKTESRYISLYTIREIFIQLQHIMIYIQTSDINYSTIYRYKLLRDTLRSPVVGWMMYKLTVSNKEFMRHQYKSHIYADYANVTSAIIDSRHELTKMKGARYAPASFLTGLFDPVKTREEFLELFEGLEDKVPVLVVSTSSARKKSKAEMEALREVKGVAKFVEVQGALLPHEEYPHLVAREIYSFLQDLII